MNSKRGNKFFLKKNKLGLSSIVTTLIIIVLSLVAVGGVWVVVSNVLKSGTSQANFQFGTLFLDLKINNVVFDSSGNILVTVSRGTGDGDLSAIDFVISDGTNSQVIKKTSSMQQLGSQTFTLTPADLNGISSIYEIDIAPVINSGGTDQVGSKVDFKKSDYYNSCKSILSSGKSNGDGVYTIDPDGLGTSNSFQVYCDMTTDGGGWTLVARSVQGSSGNMGWKVNAGNIGGTSSYYSLGSPSIDNMKFNELLLGKEQTGNAYRLDRSSSNNLAKISNIPNNFLSLYTSTSSTPTLLVSSNTVDLNNGPTSYGSYSWRSMISYIGLTDRTDVYFFRDVVGATSFGLNPAKINTCYNTGNFCNGNTACSCSSSTDNFLLFVR